jgi:hypothetical protein
MGREKELTAIRYLNGGRCQIVVRCDDLGYDNENERLCI